MRARGFGGVPLESRELMLASDLLRGGAAVAACSAHKRAHALARYQSFSSGRSHAGKRSSLTRPRRAPNEVRETSARRPCRSSVAAA